MTLNSRLDSVQAAVLRIKLQYLDMANNRRQEIACRYGAVLGQTDIVPPGTMPENKHVYHQYVVRSSIRDAFRDHLRRNRIQTAVHYPQPIHAQPAYKNRLPIYGGCLSHTEKACNEIVSLPCFPELTDQEVEKVAKCILAFQKDRMTSESNSVRKGGD